MTTKPPWDDPDVQAWMENARVNLIPMIAESDSVASLVPRTQDDIKYAVELGLSIMMDKPIIAIVLDDRPVPYKLRIVADDIIHMKSSELGTKAGQAKMMAVIEKLTPDNGLGN